MKKKNVLVALALLALFGLIANCGGKSSSSSATLAPSKITVVSVTDGNTLVVLADGKEKAVDVLGVDVPHVASDSQQVECLGPEAKKLLEELVPVGSEVKLEGHTDGGEAQVINSAGVSVDAALLESGLGVSSDPQAVVPRDLGLFDKKIECTLAGQIAILSERATVAMADSDRSTSAKQLAVITGIAAVKESAVALANLVSGQPHSGASLVLKSRQTSDLLTSNVSYISRSLDMRSDNLQKAYGYQVKNEAETAARKAAWDAAAPQREADRQAYEAAMRDYNSGSASGSGSSGGDTYTGPRCYAPGGKTYRPC